MYFKISPWIGLRSWPSIPYAFYIRNYPYAQSLTEKEFSVMLRCDGEQEIEFDKTVASLSMRQLIVSCEKGDRPDEWSLHRHYDNRYFPRMNLMITGKCNYNCLHCFNAADNAPLMSEWTFEELCDLFDQARDCGIHAFTVTGGEPMVHKRFMDILREIHKRGMFVEELNTNGFYITQDILDQMKEIGCRPLVKISFDGIGHHDWMRARKGAEGITLDAMRLCVNNGFRVKSQTQVHRRNVESMMPTARVLNDMGVDEMRIIRTTEVPRWMANAADTSLSMQEYYEKMLAFAREYADSGMGMEIDIWQLLRLHPAKKSFHIMPVSCAEGEYRATYPGCRGNRGMIAVTSSGEVVPCLQLSGVLLDLDIHIGNLHDTPLRNIIDSGAYLDTVCTTVGELREKNEKCGNCKWFEYCTGGCRALGMLFSGQKKDFLGEDITKCQFFENGWYERTAEALRDWENKSPVRLV